jgi:hypothetical protein
MRLGAIILALALGPGCQSLTTVGKTPDRDAVSAILVRALACKDADGEEPKCKAEEQPARVRLTALDCVALPLRSAVREQAHARCEWEGKIIQANGVEVETPKKTAEFSLIDLTPGAYRPTREWAIERLE